MRNVVLSLVLLICVGCTGDVDGTDVPQLPLSASITGTRDSAGTWIVSVQVTNPYVLRAESNFCAGRIDRFRDDAWIPLRTTWGDPPIVCTGETEVLQPKSSLTVEYRISGVALGDRIRFVGQGATVRPGSLYEPQLVLSGEHVI